VTCAFCEIVHGGEPASFVYQDEATVALVDLRQFHAGHTIVIPREHVPDIRSATPELAQAVMATVLRVSQALAAAFQSDGLSVWHSAGPGANQEVPHLHFHVHPRFIGDQLLHIYPAAAPLPSREALDSVAQRIRQSLQT